MGFHLGILLFMLFYGFCLRRPPPCGKGGWRRRRIGDFQVVAGKGGQFRCKLFRSCVGESVVQSVLLRMLSRHSAITIFKCQGLAPCFTATLIRGSVAFDAGAFLNGQSRVRKLDPRTGTLPARAGATRAAR